jgi:hypothetical protein
MSLPHDVWRIIGWYLPAEDLGRLRRVCWAAAIPVEFYERREIFARRCLPRLQMHVCGLVKRTNLYYSHENTPVDDHIRMLSRVHRYQPVQYGPGYIHCCDREFQAIIYNAARPINLPDGRVCYPADPPRASMYSTYFHEDWMKICARHRQLDSGKYGPYPCTHEDDPPDPIQLYNICGREIDGARRTRSAARQARRISRRAHARHARRTLDRGRRICPEPW